MEKRYDENLILTFYFLQATAFVGIGCIAPDEERLVLLKPVVQFYFIYDASKGFLCIYLYELHH